MASDNRTLRQKCAALRRRVKSNARWKKTFTSRCHQPTPMSSFEKKNLRCRFLFAVVCIRTTAFVRRRRGWSVRRRVHVRFAPNGPTRTTARPSAQLVAIDRRHRLKYHIATHHMRPFRTPTDKLIATDPLTAWWQSWCHQWSSVRLRNGVQSVDSKDASAASWDKQEQLCLHDVYCTEATHDADRRLFSRNWNFRTPAPGAVDTGG